MIPTCSTCWAYRPDDNGTTGRCRAALPIVRDANHLEPDAAYDPQACWPSVHPEDWCAEHGEPDDNPNPAPAPRWVTIGLTAAAAALAGRVSRR